MRTEGKWPNKVRDFTMQPSNEFPKLIVSEYHCNGLGGGDGSKRFPVGVTGSSNKMRG